MDFSLLPSENAVPATMSFAPAQGLLNNIYLSVTIEHGSWFAAPTFGRKKRGRLKNTPETSRLLQGDFEAALQWLLDSKRARSIVVTIQRDPVRWPHAQYVSIEVLAADGSPVTYNQFVEVV